MEIIPAIYIQGGEAISLYKGKPNPQTKVYRNKPLDLVKRFKNHGAHSVLVVDIDGTVNNMPTNIEIIRSIVKHVDIRLIYAGGVRHDQHIQSLFNLEVDIVVLGVSSKDIIHDSVSKYGADKIWSGIKAKRNIIYSKAHSNLEVIDYGLFLESSGIQNIIYKDLESEGTLFHPNFEEVDRLVDATGLNIYCFGGIASDYDLSFLGKIKTKGAIISRAFLENKLPLNFLNS